MKQRCPYCKEVSEWGDATQCPKCAKAALPSSFFRRGKKLKKEGRRRTREQGTVQPWLMSGKLMGVFLIWTKIPRWIIWLGGLAIIGAFIYGPKMKADLPEVIRLTEENLSVLKVALEMFKDDCGRYPKAEEGLNALVSKPEGLESWHGPYIKALKDDPWKHPYKYESQDGGSSMELWSLGPDGLNKTADDVHPISLPQPEEPEEVQVSIGGREAPSEAKEPALESPKQPAPAAP